MKLYEGTLHFYAATGETPHFYCYTGNVSDEQHDWSNHVILGESDGVEIVSPDDKTRIIIHFFPSDVKTLKKMLKSKGYKTFLKASGENWKTSVVKYHIGRGEIYN